jgi:hypothetical protein
MDILGVKQSYGLVGSIGRRCINMRKGEDHVWFEDRWMVASWCDE